MLDALKDPSISALVATICTAIITAAISVWIMLQTKKRKKIFCFIEEVTQVFQISEKWRDLITVTVKSKEVTDLHIFKLRIKNIGNASLTDQPIRICFPDGAKFLGSTMKSDSIPGDQMERDKESDNIVNFNIKLINPREHLTINMLCADNNGGIIDISMRSEDVESIIRRRSENYDEILNFAATISSQGLLRGGFSVVSASLKRTMIP